MKNLKFLFLIFITFVVISCSEDNIYASKDIKLYTGNLKIGQIIQKFFYDNETWYLIKTDADISHMDYIPYTLVNDKKGYQIPVDGTYLTKDAKDNSFTLPLLKENTSFYTSIKVPTKKSANLLFQLVDAKNDKNTFYLSVIPKLSFDDFILNGDGTLYDGTPISEFFTLLDTLDNPHPNIKVTVYSATDFSFFFPLNINGHFHEKEEN